VGADYLMMSRPSRNGYARNGKEKRRAETLSGATEKIADGVFVFGLRAGSGESEAIWLLTQQEWLDFPIAFGDGRIAKLTFEEGMLGRKALRDALSAWGIKAQFSPFVMKLPFEKGMLGRKDIAAIYSPGPAPQVSASASRENYRYLKMLFDRIMLQRRDPPHHLRKAVTSVIAFRLDDDGNVTRTHIYKTSNYPDYDKASIEAVIQAGPSPRPSPGMPNGFLATLKYPSESGPVVTGSYLKPVDPSLATIDSGRAVQDAHSLKGPVRASSLGKYLYDEPDRWK
jgi:hypothetical protein